MCGGRVKGVSRFETRRPLRREGWWAKCETDEGWVDDYSPKNLLHSPSTKCPLSGTSTELNDIQPSVGGPGPVYRGHLHVELPSLTSPRVSPPLCTPQRTGYT